MFDIDNTRLRFPLCLTLLLLGSGAATAEPVVTYAADVRPVLERHCTSCHSGWFPSASLDLSNLADILKGGKSGPLVVAGQPDKGWLMFSVTRATGRQRMPPEGKGTPLSDADKALIGRWIEQGLRP